MVRAPDVRIGLDRRSEPPRDRATLLDPRMPFPRAEERVRYGELAASIERALRDLAEPVAFVYEP